MEGWGRGAAAMSLLRLLAQLAVELAEVGLTITNCISDFSDNILYI